MLLLLLYNRNWIIRLRAIKLPYLLLYRGIFRRLPLPAQKVLLAAVNREHFLLTNMWPMESCLTLYIQESYCYYSDTLGDNLTRRQSVGITFLTKRALFILQKNTGQFLLRTKGEITKESEVSFSQPLLINTDHEKMKLSKLLPINTFETISNCQSHFRILFNS